MSTKPGDASAPSGRAETGKTGPARIGLTKIIGGTAALALLTVLGTYIFGGFNGLTVGGVVALILGVTLSYALGVGLMVAVFYSSRFYDDSAHQAALDHFTDRRKDLDGP